LDVNVLYFHQYFTTPNGAGGTRSYEQALALARRGHQVMIVCGRTQGSTSGITGQFRNGVRRGLFNNLEIIEFDLPYSNHLNLILRSFVFLQFAWRSILIALTARCDIVVATSTPLTIALPGIAAAIFRGKPFVFEVRDLWPELPRAMGVIRSRVVLAALSFLEWASYKTATACVGLSPGIVEGIARIRGDRDAIAMIPNACDVELFTMRQKRTRNAGFVAVFAGAHGQANGIDAILDAASVLRANKREDIRLLLVGDGKLKPQLQARALRENLANCEFRGPVPKNQVADILNLADVGLQILANVPAFYYGTSPNKFFDYLASGLPVLTNYPGWVADLVTTHRCGVAVPPGDPKAFAEALIHLADNPHEVLAMRQNARLLAERGFNRTRFADAFVDVIEAALANNGPRTARRSIAMLSPSLPECSLQRDGDIVRGE
jgi:glycosyltransferase involved in cell wall biosynthesis